MSCRVSISKAAGRQRAQQHDMQSQGSTKRAALLAGSERGEGAALERAVADALARAVGASGAPAGVWGLLAGFHRATGSRASEREALLKQVGFLKTMGSQACESIVQSPCCT